MAALAKRLLAAAAWVVCVWVVFVPAPSGGVAAGEEAGISRPPGDGPTEVRVGMIVVDVDDIDTANQNFTVNLYMQFQWHDSRLARKDSQEIRRPLDRVWHPELQLVNQQRLWRTFPEAVRISPEGDVVYRQRVWGSFSQPLRLEDFPFDVQTFNIQLAAVGHTTKEVKIVELIKEDGQKSTIAKHLSVADWDVCKFTVEPAPYAPVPGAPEVAGFRCSFTAKRRSGYYTFKVIIPIALITAISWVAFWIDPKEVGTNIGVATTAILALVAYRFAIGDAIPKVPYMTRLEEFIILSLFLVFASLGQVVFNSSLVSRGRVDLARRLDRWSRFAHPVIFCLIMLWALVI